MAIALPLPAAAAGEKAERTLDEITIEGEVPLPQVLFVSPMERARLEGVVASLLAPSWRDAAASALLPVAFCFARAGDFVHADPLGAPSLTNREPAPAAEPPSTER